MEVRSSKSKVEWRFEVPGSRFEVENQDQHANLELRTLNWLTFESAHHDGLDDPALKREEDEEDGEDADDRAVVSSLYSMDDLFLALT